MIIRTYQCDDCDSVFEVQCERGSDGDPDCPNCSKVLQWIPAKVNIGGSHVAKAVDVTQNIIEQDFGLTNLKDNNREGDVAYMPPAPMQTAERDAIEREVREYASTLTRNVPVRAENQPPSAQAADAKASFWGGGGSAAHIAAQPIPMQAALQGTRIGPGTEVNAMNILQKGIKSGALKNPTRIIASWKP